MKKILILSFALILNFTAQSAKKKPVKVFILAGQSNMEGKGFPEPLAWQVSQKKYRERYTHFIKDGDYEAFTKKVAETTDPNDKRKPPTYLWSSRKDVWINYLGKHGDLTVGYGTPREGFGPEFNFDHVVGNQYEEQVLLIKASWGGRALARGFRSLRFGLPRGNRAGAGDASLLGDERVAPTDARHRQMAAFVPGIARPS